MIRPLWIEINLAALRKNLKIVRGFLRKDTALVATIKQSAYGHGLLAVARELANQGVNFFGVGGLKEAISLREDGFDGSILILTAVLDEFCDLFIRHSITPTIVDEKFAKKLNKEAIKAKKTIPVHIKVDTGMGRLGPCYKEAYNFVKKISKFSNLTLEGIYTHFPVADTDAKFTNQQIDSFNELVNQLKKDKIFFKFCHCANSIGIIKYPNAHFNLVRPGLILYGIRPFCPVDLELEPVIALKSKVVFIKTLERGMSVSYGRTFIADKRKNIATVAVGYADGYPWALSSKGYALIKDTLFPIAGRVCMDHIMLDLGTRRDIKVGEEVVLIGRQKKNKITAENLAEWTQTIPYEIVSRLSARIPRVYKFSSLEQK